jgi:hypothetical protein
VCRVFWRPEPWVLVGLRSGVLLALPWSWTYQLASRINNFYRNHSSYRFADDWRGASSVSTTRNLIPAISLDEKSSSSSREMRSNDRAEVARQVTTEALLGIVTCAAHKAGFICVSVRGWLIARQSLIHRAVSRAQQAHLRREIVTCHLDAE